MSPSGLPIDATLPALRAALASGRSAVLQAPPGAGKSTVVPLALLDEPWVRGRRILLLEPRRLAARAVAQRMARTLGESVGDTVGYRMRLDTRVSRATRIEVITEGVLTRMLQSDPDLAGVALAIFDEFHERSLQADLGLALCLDGRTALGSDLRVLVMSATLDGERVAALLGGAPIVSSQGRSFEVQTHHVGKGFALLPGGAESPERLIASTVRRALTECDGDVLVFLPGAAEIRRVQGMLGDLSANGEARVLPLYGELGGAEQSAAIEPGAARERRVVLATNIAETSLTIPGVRVVVDSGLVRRSVFDPVTGMSSLQTQRISRASADQRRGRAGRTAPGVCYRLWSEGSERSLAAYSSPEIVDADLTPLALDLANWGASDVGGLSWLDAPPAATLASARDLLRQLGALDAAGRITAHGRELARLPAHPRVAHLLVEARRRGALELGADLAALLADRDLLRGAGRDDADIDSRLALLRRGFAASAGPSRDGSAGRGASEAEHATLQRARRTAEQFRRSFAQREAQHGVINGGSVSGSAAAGGVIGSAAGQVNAGLLLAAAYPDRIGQRRDGEGGRYLLANGRGAVLATVQSLGSSEYIVAIDLDDRDREARIQLAATVSRAQIEELHGARMVLTDVVEWDEREQAVRAQRVLSLDALVLERKPLVPALEAARAAMLTGVRAMGIGALPWSDELRALQARLEFARALGRRDTAAWLEVSDSGLLARLDDWLGPWLAGITRRSHLQRLPLPDMLLAHLDHGSRRLLDELAPTHIALPTGNRARIDYLDDLAPSAAMRMQEVFGLAETPRIGGGKVPVTFKLLSPAQRPLQITRDLASFWRNAYVEVRKDMRGRYPRHYWPENPLEAEPTRGIRRR